jgi:hypothetical protein
MGGTAENPNFAELYFQMLMWTPKRQNKTGWNIKKIIYDENMQV